MQLPFLRPKTPAASARPPAGPDLEPGSVEAARTRARRRLVGALVLLVLGVLTFPLLFETQPRPIGVDTPMTVAQREASQLAPARGATRPLVPLPVLPADAGIEQPAVPATEPARVTPTVAAAASAAVIAAAPPTAAPASNPPAAVAVAALPGPVSKPASAPATTAPKPSPAAALPSPAKPKPTPALAVAPEAPRATVPAEATPPTGTGRFVVQVGAFVEDRALREARQKVEKLGLKTYTQVIENDAGKRTRVRVGPFDTRAEAEAAAAKVKAGGLPANILAL